MDVSATVRKGLTLQRAGSTGGRYRLRIKQIDVKTLFDEVAGGSDFVAYPLLLDECPSPYSS